ncbi:MAG: cadherin-like domain-containing protein [Bdellovibrionales bacterium]|nr:cadherin-like domain-containing protein [Bdellovibrionales bacterium]
MRKSARSCNLYLYSLLFILSSCKGIGSPGKSLISDSNDTGSLSKSVSIETAPNGIGDQISSISLSISESLSIYAILRDEEGTFVSNTEVLWSLSGAAGSLVINQNGKSALFSALSVGTAQIKAISDEKQYVITIEVTASPNTLPVANDDGPMATAANTMISVSALLNDSDSDGDSISIVSHSASSHGSVVVNGDQLEYTPDPGFYGSDSFTYTIDDGNSGQDTATVQLIVVDNFTWIGTGGNNLWTNGSNWCGNIVNQNCSGGSAPGNLDLARFNSSCLNNCEVTINASINIFGIIMQDSFSGTIEQGSGSMMILGSDGFTQRGGSFIGSDANITLTEGLFSLIGGSFTNTSSTFKLTRTTNVNETYFTVNSVATFLHNNGTVNFIAQRPWECGNTKLTLDIPSTLDFYNVRFDGKTSGCGGGSSENVVKAGSTLVVTNDLTLGGGYLSGDLELKGNLLIPNDAPLWLRAQQCKYHF